jgi:hypothetical protein
LKERTFGVLTLATPSDFPKAIGLSLSLRISNPEVKLAVACAPHLEPILTPYFNYIIHEDRTLRGFEHKVNLDRYSPFDDTFFFDSDVLVFGKFSALGKHWWEQSYSVCGRNKTDGYSCFGLDRAQTARKLGVSQMVDIDGAGHALFRSPECKPLFEKAREITKDFKRWTGTERYADEDIVAVAMTVLAIKPMPDDTFLATYVGSKKHLQAFDASKGVCIDQDGNGRTRSPMMMHFAANQAPVAYFFQLSKLYKRFNVNRRDLVSMTIKDSYIYYIQFWLMGTIKGKIKMLLKKWQ